MPFKVQRPLMDVPQAYELTTRKGTFEVADSVPFYGPGEGDFSSWRFHIPTGYQRASVRYRQIFRKNHKPKITMKRN